MSAPVRQALERARHDLDAWNVAHGPSPHTRETLAMIDAALATPDPTAALAEAVRAYAPHHVISVELESDIAYERRRMRWIAVQEALAAHDAAPGRVG